MSIERIAGRLKENSIRPTHQRIKVYEYLLEHPIHPSVDTIYTALSPDHPSFSKTTVYNTLDVLLKAELIRAIALDGREVRYDGNPEEHGHFYCRLCDTVSDFNYTGEDFQSCDLEDFVIERRELYLFGQCSDCARK